MSTNKLKLADLDSINSTLQLALDSISNNTAFDYDLEIDKSLCVHIKLYGSKFSNSLTGQAARGLWEFQQEIYRAVAYTLYGQASIKKLTKEDLENYNLVFTINEGSTEVNALLEKFLEFLQEELKGMNPAEKIITLVAIVAIITYGFVTYSLESQRISSTTQISLEQERNKIEEIKEKEHTRHLELMAQVKMQTHIATVWEESVREGVKSIAKSLEEEDSMDFGQYHIPKESIKQLKQKAPKSLPDEDTITDIFTLYGFREISKGEILFEIRGASGEYSVLADQDSFTEEELKYLTHTAADIRPLKMTIKLIMIREKVKAAYISNFEKQQKDIN